MNITYKKDGILIDNEFISKEDLINNMLKIGIKEDNLVLLKLEWRANRNFDGVLEEYVAPKDKIIQIVEIIKGKTINFGSIAGKHSEIDGELENSDIFINENVDDILNFLKTYPTKHNYNHSFLNVFYDSLCDQSPKYFGLDTEEELIELSNKFKEVY